MNQTQTANPICRAIDLAGGVAPFARALGVTYQAAANWRDGVRSAPVALCPTIERLWGVPCEEMRPDVEWSYLRGTKSNLADQQAAGQGVA